MRVKCYNYYDLLGVCRSYVGLVASGVDGAARVRLHEKISDMTGIPYDELKEYLWNLDRYGYTLDLERMELSEEYKLMVERVAERLTEALFNKIELDFTDKISADKVIDMEFNRYGYDIESWIDEWKRNGYWICDGEPVLRIPEQAV